MYAPPEAGAGRAREVVGRRMHTHVGIARAATHLAVVAEQAELAGPAAEGDEGGGLCRLGGLVY